MKSIKFPTRDIVNKMNNTIFIIPDNNAHVQRRIMEGTKCVIAIAETPFGPGIIRPLATPS